MKFHKEEATNILRDDEAVIVVFSRKMLGNERRDKGAHRGSRGRHGKREKRRTVTLRE